MRTARASVKDVALKAGVSVGTVSNVLNRPELVTDTTRARVEAAMRDLNFVRNATAQQLRVGTSQTVGAVLLDLSNPFYTAVVRGIEDRLSEQNLALMVGSSDENPDREARFLRLFAEQGVRGVVITPSEGTEQHLEMLGKLGIPCVLLDARSETNASVGVDNVWGAREAVRHLLDQGHRTIAFINGPPHLQQCVDRLEGARRAVQEAGLDVDETLIVRQVEAMTADEGQEAFVAILDNPGPKPTATFCINDIVALGVMRELRRRRLEIPDRMAVVGYDDVHFAAELMTPLTSVHQPMHELGWTAADMLLAGAPASEHKVFRPELIVRRSSRHGAD